MTIIRGTTKKGQSMIARANNYEGFRLWDVYESFSQAKENAWQHCYKKCLAENGWDFGICSHNTFGFSVSWFTVHGIRIETPQNSYLIIFPE